MTAPGNSRSARDAEQPSSAGERTPAADPATEASSTQPARETDEHTDATTRDASGVDANGVATTGDGDDRGQDDVLAELEAVQARLAEAHDEVLRARAEMENVRRRAEQEIVKARKFAVEGFAAELLQVKDSLDLAANVDLEGVDAPVVKNMHEGLALTRRQIDTVFEKFGVVALEPAAGEKLNPELHQAMTVQESAEVPPGHILLVIQKGFTLNDRLLRPAMVIVAKAPAD